MKSGQRREFTKHASGFFGTGKMMKRWKKRETAECPRCGAPVEDDTHILKCPQAAATDLWDKSLKDLREWLKKKGTEPQIREVILDSLSAWRDGREPTAFRDETCEIHRLYTMQDEIGWKAAINGCWAKGWKEAQELYYQSRGSEKTGRRWLSALITKLWQVAWDQWQHRNGILHDVDDGLLAQQLKFEIRAQYELGFEGFRRNTRGFTRQTIEEVLKKPLRDQQVWLERITTARDYKDYLSPEAKQATRLRKQQRLFAAWLGS